MKTKFLQPPYVEVEWGGGRYSPGESSVLMQIVPYSSSIYTVFHSVIYNSKVQPLPLNLSFSFFFRYETLFCWCQNGLPEPESDL